MMYKKSYSSFLLLMLILTGFYPVAARGGALPEGFVYVEDTIPSITVELRYYSTHNFVGDRIDGYMEPRCVLTKNAAEAMRGAQEELKTFGLGLKIYDAYRPQMAVDHFVRWAKDLGDVRMKKEFYPNVEKENLFKDGYIAEKSGHSRGSTVDLTIIPVGEQAPGTELDMGTGFDYFGPQSWPDNPEIGAAQRAHRMLLQAIMKKHGFRPYPQEWWHFTLEQEPYPDTYFNFPIH